MIWRAATERRLPGAWDRPQLVAPDSAITASIQGTKWGRAAKRSWMLAQGFSRGFSPGLIVRPRSAL